MDVLQEAVAYLESRHIEHARLNAERLLAHILGVSRMDLYLQFEKPLKTEEREAYKHLLRRRAGREPLQTILGETEFMSLPFNVTENVLIPRPETEILVENAIEITKTRFGNKSSIHILDIGTGSGCIAVSLARYLKNARILAVDQHPAALNLARKNAELNAVNDQIEFIRMNIIESSGMPGKIRFDLIVSNPPYIRTPDLPTLPPEIRDHEPVDALDGGPDGLRYYRSFQSILPDWLNESGAVLLEIGADQAKDVQNIFSQSPWTSIRLLQDLAGLDRVIILSK
ncbi:peptide chain release factor N(5)-glutamine methyltransferase [bacterium]|nr:peptide chain release factor N(5)-glutamine methyltransferase [bacterium]